MSKVRQNRTFGYVLIIFGALASIALLWGLSSFTEYARQEWGISPSAFRSAAVATVVVVGGGCWIWGSRHLQPLADEVMATDSRAPILYLRSFEEEGRVYRIEEAFADLFAPIGPFIAVGQPGERLPPLGAARLYLEDEDWQSRVLALLKEARQVLIYGGPTPGLAWEMAQVRRIKHPTRVVIMVPDNKQSYDAFVRTVSSATDLTLPTYPSGESVRHAGGGVAGFLSFDDNWTPRFQSLPGSRHHGRGVSQHTYDKYTGRAALALSAVYRQVGLRVAAPSVNVLSILRKVAFTIAVISAIGLVAVLVLVHFEILVETPSGGLGWNQRIWRLI